MQMLFQGDIGKQTPEEVRGSFWAARSETELDPEIRGFAEDIYRVASVREAEIDTLIEQNSANWRLSRMPAGHRNPLRAAVADILGFPATAAPIIINESLEVARRYS